jgi:hypothetical protein
MIKPSTKEKPSKSNKVVIAVFIVVLLLIVGFVVHHNHDKNRTFSAATAITRPVPTKSPKTTTQIAPISATAVSSFVTSFYNRYIECTNTGDLNQTCTTDLVSQYGTSNLTAYVKPVNGDTYAADPILCAQNVPSSVSVSGVTTTSLSASGIVMESFTKPAAIKFSVVNDSGSLKIDTVTCSPPLVATQGGQ